MSSTLTLTLDDDVLAQAERLSRESGRPVADVLTEAIKATLKPPGAPAAPRPVADLDDDELLATADSMMDDAQGDRLSVLLERQREDEITPGERDELTALMRVYQEGQLRKAQALADAVRRVLRGPPPP